MINKAFIYCLIYMLLVFTAYSQDKSSAEEKTTSSQTPVAEAHSSKVTKNTTDMSEKTSQNTDRMEKEAGIQKALYEEPELNMEPSEELKALLSKRQKIIDDLNNADKEMNALISKSTIWDKERNTEKKGHLDTILDKADRLAFSNELRMTMSSQAKSISSLLAQFNLIEKQINKQKISDEKKRQTEALKLRVKLLEKKQKLLLEQISTQQPSETNTVSTNAVQTKREDNVEYYTITEDTNLQTVALSYYQDHEKWIIIFEHPDNQKVLKQKSPTAIIPIGTVLTIPKEAQE